MLSLDVYFVYVFILQVVDKSNFHYCLEKRYAFSPQNPNEGCLEIIIIFNVLRMLTFQVIRVVMHTTVIEDDPTPLHQKGIMVLFVVTL